MSSELVTVATFMTPEEALLARNALESIGVRAVVTDGAVIGMQWALGNALGGVKLQVGDDDVERARGLLDTNGRHVGRPATSAAHWQCARCQESVDGGFDVCWSCGATRDGREDPDFVKVEAEVYEDTTAVANEPSCAIGVEQGETTDQSFDGGDGGLSWRIIAGLVMALVLGFVLWNVARMLGIGR